MGIDMRERIEIVCAVVGYEWSRGRGTEWLQPRETRRRLEGEGIRIIVEKRICLATQLRLERSVA